MIKLAKTIDFRLNFLSVINVTMAFLCFYIITYKFGAGSSTDHFFKSVVLMGFASTLIQWPWEFVANEYVGSHNTIKSSLFYSHIFGMLIISALLLLVTSIVWNLGIAPATQLNIFVLILGGLGYSIIQFSKRIMQLESCLKESYLVDIALYCINSVLFIINNDPEILIYLYVMCLLLCAPIAAFSAAKLFQLRIVKIGFVHILGGLKCSTPNKIAAISQTFRDSMLPNLFELVGSGLYSTFTIASKVVNAVSLVFSYPVHQSFSNDLLVKKESIKDQNLFKKLKWQILYLVAIVSLLSILSIVGIYYVSVSIKNSIFSSEFITVGMGLIVINVLINIEQFPARVLSAMKKYNSSLIVNAAILIIFLSFYYKKFILESAISLMAFLVALQLINMIFYICLYYREVSIRN